jgi:Fe-S-cluster-containing dehydrogenase component
VLVDRKWCIGCGYCIMGCPYGVRFFHPVHKVAEKCNFCYERLAAGLIPACVDACKCQALCFGDLEDPNSEVRKLLASRFSLRRKPELGTQPNVYYLV